MQAMVRATVTLRQKPPVLLAYNFHSSLQNLARKTLNLDNSVDLPTSTNIDFRPGF